MTAVVGILNKQAVALAADSAVTISGGSERRIFNRANKLFALSKFHPVGIMIYNSASFMETPWETIIKIYRKNLGKKSFDTLEEYQNDFIEFLRQKSFFSSAGDQLKYIFQIFYRAIDSINKDIIKGFHFEQPLTNENKGTILTSIEERVDNLINRLEQQNKVCPELQSLTFEEFNAFTAGTFEEVINSLFVEQGFFIGEQLRDKLRKLLHLFTISKETSSSYTGVIFSGFGENDIYPKLIPVNISLAIQNRLKYFIDEEMKCSVLNNESGFICPFAQTDVIDTILTGIDPTLDNIYLQNFSSFLSKYNQEILNILGPAAPELSAQIAGLNIHDLVKEYNRINQQTQQVKYIQPLMNAVSHLSKEDLAEMAESLIYLTYLKRRITFAEESVGGPVDVALISKGEGLIWIKRKHYFKPELNQHFFQNYFNI